ncbi:tetratricopeptide repeat protein [Nocardia takedensis]
MDEAEQAFLRARDIADRLPGDDSSARVTAALGTVYHQRREYQSARAAFADAASVFRRLGDDYTATLCEQNLASTAAMLDDVGTGLELARRACRYYDSNPALRWRSSAAYRALAVLQAEAGQGRRALWSLARARVVCEDFGLMVEMAEIDTTMALLFVHDTRPRRRNLVAALKRALPATLFIDGARVGFPSATSRVAWRGRISGGDLSRVFDWVHRTEDAVLPMRPPPRLLMPDGRVALGRYLRLADERYGVIARPATVRTW